MRKNNSIGQKLVKHILATPRTLCTYVEELRQHKEPSWTRILPHNAYPAYIRLSVQINGLKEVVQDLDSVFMSEDFTNMCSNRVYFKLTWDMYNDIWEVLPFTILNTSRLVQYIPAFPAVVNWYRKNLCYTGASRTGYTDDDVQYYKVKYLQDPIHMVYNVQASSETSFNLNSYYIVENNGLVHIHNNKLAVDSLYLRMLNKVKVNASWCYNLVPSMSSVIFNLPEEVMHD